MTARFRRPAMLSAQRAEEIVGDVDPASRSEAAHATAVALVVRGRAAAHDDDLVARLVELVDNEGIDDLAMLWSNAPATTLPGALWRLYQLREWTRNDAHRVAEHFRLGSRAAQVDEVVAGVAPLPGPSEVRDLADAVLTGVYRGDFAVALERAGAFCRVLAAGCALDADTLTDDAEASRLTRQGATLQAVAEELTVAAGLWRAEKLD
ncbi:hypothetical protein [Pseudactinotalea sp. HY158]|uniref:hypothetical protein n=1 Tax=Pseudactinotalea sp. HY158 TaxID=2654547 RepID=UPI00351A9406